MWKHLRPLGILALVSVITKVLVVFVTIYIFHSFFDFWAIGVVYLNSAVIPFLTSGSLPYIDYTWNYPPLMFIPTGIATLVMILVRNQEAFAWTYLALMVICDFITIGCVYFITLKVGGNLHVAFVSGFLTATAISAAYGAISCYDALAVMLMMLGIVFAIYNQPSARSYAFILLGYFAKLFPILLLPFVFFHNRDRSDLKTELKEFLKVALPLTIILVIPLLLIAPSTMDVYLDRTSLDNTMVGSSLAYAVYVIFQKIIPFDTIALVMYGILAIVLCILIWVAYHDGSKNPLHLLKYSLIALTSLIVFIPHHSPQYMMWIVPFLAILSAGNLQKIIWFYILQVLLYIKFPLMFYSYWTNAGYVDSRWGITLLVFGAQFAVLAYLLWMVVKPINYIWRNHG